MSKVPVICYARALLSNYDVGLINRKALEKPAKVEVETCTALMPYASYIEIK